MLKTAILGVTGYVGQQLLSILARHKEVDLRILTSEKFSGVRTGEAFPHLSGLVDIPLSSVSKIGYAEPIDIVFSCLPGGVSAIFVKKFLEKGSRVIDLSSDFRFSSPDDYSRVHGKAPRFPELLPRAVYGLSELNREKIKNASFIANAGCYATCVSLGLVPFLSAGNMEEDIIIVDIKSSFSTSGRAPKSESHYPEVKEDLSSEYPGGQDQKYEVEKILSSFCDKEKRVLFFNTRVPVKRGIMAVSYIKPHPLVSLDTVRDLYLEFYDKDAFIRILDDGVPAIASGSCSNYLSLGFCVREEHLIIVSVLDNLMKGAAGQAVQNMNIAFGFREEEGLEMNPLFP